MGEHAPPPPPPCVDVARRTWTETLRDGTEQVHHLKAGQVRAYQLLERAGTKQLLSFLSGEGGMGKSFVIRMLVQRWRSQGHRVIVLGSSAKAARLIGGHTVHSACKLHQLGYFQVRALACVTRGARARGGREPPD